MTFGMANRTLIRRASPLGFPARSLARRCDGSLRSRGSLASLARTLRRSLRLKQLLDPAERRHDAAGFVRQEDEFLRVRRNLPERFQIFLRDQILRWTARAAERLGNHLDRLCFCLRDPETSLRLAFSGEDCRLLRSFSVDDLRLF